MKFDFCNEAITGSLGGAGFATLASQHWGLSSESDPLTDVLVVSPDHLAPVACCSVTREKLLNGYRTDSSRARMQHEALISALQASGVRVHRVAGASGLPDMVFARDAGLMTPWGYLPLAPGAGHRSREALVLADHVRSSGVPVLPQISGGTIEGGDISIF